MLLLRLMLLVVMGPTRSVPDGTLRVLPTILFDVKLLKVVLCSSNCSGISGVDGFCTIGT